GKRHAAARRRRAPLKTCGGGRHRDSEHERGGTTRCSHDANNIREEPRSPLSVPIVIVIVIAIERSQDMREGEGSDLLPVFDPVVDCGAKVNAGVYPGLAVL